MESTDPIQAIKPQTSEDVELNLTLTSKQLALIGELRQRSPSFKVYPQDAIGDEGNKFSDVAIAIGSNLGDSCRNIEFSLRLLEVPTKLEWAYPEGAQIEITDTSFLYETAPMYVVDQPNFYNAACMIKTNMEPYKLLEFLKVIESTVGRVPTFRNGPRAIDLDILFYDRYVFPHGDNWQSPLANTEDRNKLIVPHIGIAEREFVLRPLNDMIPDFIHPTLNLPLWYLLKKLLRTSNDPMNRVIPFPRLPLPTASLHPAIPPIPETLTTWTYPRPPSSTSTPTSTSNSDVNAPYHPTRVMATLNVTPDSFSDGNQHYNLPDGLSYIRTSILDGASIIDMGGYSTRPGAADIDVDEEIQRVVPVVQAMRSLEVVRGCVRGREDKDKKGDAAVDADADADTDEDLTKRITETPISVDTFRWQVAEAALNAGANCINDVYAFTATSPWKSESGSVDWSTHEELNKMKEVARRFCCPVVMMHSRGDAGRNKDYGEYGYIHSDQRGGRKSGVEEVLEGVRVELGRKVNAVVLGRGGLRRWFIIADPGVGFSKTVEANLGLIKYAQETVADINISRDEYLNPLRGLPLLIGASRKSFLGEILSQPPAPRKAHPQDRVYATTAAVACAVQQQALVVRVHDVKAMMDVVKVAEALGRV